MQSAYDTRSAIAHGGSPKPRDVKLRGEKVELAVLVEATRTVMREALSHALEAVGSSWPVHWEDLIFDRLASNTPSPTGSN